MKTSSLHQVFTVADPRLQEPESLVYVGVTQRPDPDFSACITAVFREHLPEFRDELQAAGKRATVLRRGPRIEKTAALQLKYELIKKYEASGSKLRHNPRAGGAPFTIVEQQDESVS